MRRSRQLKDGARYHVSARANRKEMILDNKMIKELFLSVLRRAKVKFAFKLENFCIMGNHYHLVIMPKRGTSLSTIMQWIMSVFAMAYNKITGQTGHVWGGRFFSRIIETLREYQQVYEYINENPVKSGNVRIKWYWKWGGLWHLLTRRRDLVDELPPFIQVNLIDTVQLLLN